MSGNKESDDKTTRDQCTETYFSMTEDNAYGFIPLLGAVASCLVVGSIIMIFHPQEYMNTWFHIGFMIFVAVQVFWGFQCASGAQAKKRKCLALWLACKIGEILLPIGFLISNAMIELFIPLFIMHIVLLCVGFRKFILMGKPQISIFTNQTIPYTITK